MAAAGSQACGADCVQGERDDLVPAITCWGTTRRHVYGSAWHTEQTDIAQGIISYGAITSPSPSRSSHGRPLGVACGVCI